MSKEGFDGPRETVLVKMTLFFPTYYNFRLSVDEIFSDAFSKDLQLIKVDPKNGKYLACALMARGQFNLSDIRRNIERLAVINLWF